MIAQSAKRQRCPRPSATSQGTEIVVNTTVRGLIPSLLLVEFNIRVFKIQSGLSS